MSQPAAPIHQPITATLTSHSHIWSVMSSCRNLQLNSSHIAMPHLTTRQFSRHIQTIHINAAPASSYQTTQRHYLIYLRPSAHPQPRLSVLLSHFLSTNIPIPHTPVPHIREAMQPLPIPTHGKPWSHCLSPTILPSYILVNNNHSSFSNASAIFIYLHAVQP